MRLCAEGGGGSCWRQRETFPQDTKSKKEIRNKKLLYAKRMLFTWYAALPTIPCLFPLSSSLSRCESFLLSLLSTFSPLFLSFATHLKVYRCVMNRYGNKRRTLLEIWKKKRRHLSFVGKVQRSHASFILTTRTMRSVIFASRLFFLFHTM